MSNQTRGERPKFPERNRASNENGDVDDPLTRAQSTHEDPHPWDIIIAHFLGGTNDLHAMMEFIVTHFTNSSTIFVKPTPRVGLSKMVEGLVK